MSNINYLSINENFPVPGQDNDTQVFRDNFDTIKQSLRIAGEEITDLQDNVARTDLDSDFNSKIIQNAVLLNTVDKKLDGGNYTNPVLTVDYENGNYQIFRLFQDTTIQFQNLPNDDVFEGRAVGKLTLEIYGDGTTRTVRFSTTGGTVFKASPDFPNPLTVTSAEAGAGAGNPTIVEVWSHKNDRIFLNHLGRFDTYVSL